jgi:hypothetical protein
MNKQPVPKAPPLSDEDLKDIFTDFDDVDVEEEILDESRRPPVLPPPSHPMPCAKAFIEPYRKDGLLTLRNWRWLVGVAYDALGRGP